MTYKVIETPAELVDEVKEYREKMLEQVAEFDDTLMEFKRRLSIVRDKGLEETVLIF